MRCQFQYVELLHRTTKFVVLSEAAEQAAQSKNLRADFTANVIQVRRFFDSLPLAQYDKFFVSFHLF